MTEAFHFLRGEIKFWHSAGTLQARRCTSSHFRLYELVVHRAKGTIMPRRPSAKTDQFNATAEADEAAKVAETIKLSERDFNRILELLERSPRPNAKLRAAIAALPDTI
ncbi:type II toxin -antitoxin system TacA 1-like antitoxin [Mesorhizobium sp. ORM8.1]